MPDAFLQAYIHTVTIAFTTALVAILAIHAPRATAQGLSPRLVPWTLGGTGLLLGLWYAFAAWLAGRGIMGTGLFGDGPPLIGVFVVVGAALLFALGRLVAPARALIDRIGQNYLMGLQGFRILGGIFLVGWATGQVPALFAIPAGLGDILAGILGLQAMRAVNRGATDARRKVLVANLWGIADFAIAVGTGLVTSDTAYQLVAHDAPNIVGFYPLVMIPALLVPIFLALHFFSLQKLARDRDVTAQPA